MTDAVNLSRELRIVRELLVRVQGAVDESDALVLQGAVDRVDLVGNDLPGWPEWPVRDKTAAG